MNKLFVEKKTPFRAWFYFRQGWSLYFAFIFAAINTLTVTYYLAIERYPVLVQIFPSFLQYVSIVGLIGIPSLIIIGYIHFKKSPAYRSEVGVGWESNPYARRNLINSELNLQFNRKIMQIMLKLLENEKFDQEQLQEITKIQLELNNFINERSTLNKKDLEFLKKMNLT